MGIRIIQPTPPQETPNEQLQKPGCCRMSAPSPQRRRRQVAVPQSMIARAVRVAHEAGPTWRVLIKDNVVELFQGDAPPIAAPVAPNNAFARGLGIVP